MSIRPSPLKCLHPPTEGSEFGKGSDGNQFADRSSFSNRRTSEDGLNRRGDDVPNSFAVAALILIILIVPIVLAPSVSAMERKYSRSDRIVFTLERSLYKYYGPGQMAISPNGSYLVKCMGGFLEILNTTSWQMALQLTAEARHVSFSPDGELLAACCDDCYLKVWDTTTWTLIMNVYTRVDNRLLWGSATDFSSDGSLLAVSYYGRVMVWETSTWDNVVNITDNQYWIDYVEFSPDGRYMALSTLSKIGIYDTDSWNMTHQLLGHDDEITCLDFSPDGRYLASSSEDSTIKIWDTSTWADVKTLSEHNDPVAVLSFSGDGSYLVSGSHDTTVKIWDTTNWASTQTLTEHTEVIRSLALSSTGDFFVSGDRDHMRIWGRDSDLDGCPDRTDEFPGDPAAALDSDKDGAPDEWNEGKTRFDSTTGLVRDAFPDDPAASMDTDGDGSPDEWNNGMAEEDSMTYLHLDAFPGDPAASVDHDGDGFPGQWNEGKTQYDSTTGLHLDSFPLDPTASMDTDGDSFPDGWNGGKTQSDSITGMDLDAFPTDPSAAVDTDSDGYPDMWNRGRSERDSTTGLHLDAFPDDIAASVDTDGDGFPDGWNEGRTQSDSTTSLRLDAFPNDSTASVDTDGDGSPDQWNPDAIHSGLQTDLYLDAFPNDPAASVDSDGDGFPDFWNEGKSELHTTTGLALDSFPYDPAASLDTDGDGFPDQWNEGRSESDSITGLKLDEYPFDHEKWEVTDDAERENATTSYTFYYIIGGVFFIVFVGMIIAVVLIMLYVKKKRTSRAIAPPYEDMDGLVDIKPLFAIMGDRIKYGIKVTNNCSSTITNIDIKLSVPGDTLEVISPTNGIAHIGGLKPKEFQAGIFLFRPLKCVQTVIEGVVEYYDPGGAFHTVTIEPTETNLSCQFIQNKSISEVDFDDLIGRMHTSSRGFTVGNTTLEDIEKIINPGLDYMFPVTSSTLNVNEHQGRMLKLSGESIIQKSDYHLIIIIMPNAIKNGADVLVRGFSNNREGLEPFLEEVVNTLRFSMALGKDASELSIVNITEVINIIDSVIQRSKIGTASNMNLRETSEQ